MVAIELDERIGYSASSPAGQPYKGRNGRVEGARELVIHPHFVLVYEVDSPWHMDETYVKVNGRWAYLYQAVDSRGRTVDFISPPVVTAKLHTGFWVKSSTT